MSKDKYQRQWEILSQRMEKVNSELLSLTYGTLVTQLLKDFEQVDLINAQLEKMGFNIGIRLVDEFLAKTGMGGCEDFKQTAEVIAKVFRSGRVMLGMTPFLGFLSGRLFSLRDTASSNTAIPCAPSDSGCLNSFQDSAWWNRLGFRMFLGVAADVTNWDPEETACSLILHENPLADFVELPPALSQLQYSSLICGVIRGALEQLHMKVDCRFVKDMLRGDDCYEIRLELVELLKEEFIDDEDN